MKKITCLFFAILFVMIFPACSLISGQEKNIELKVKDIQTDSSTMSSMEPDDNQHNTSDNTSNTWQDLSLIVQVNPVRYEAFDPATGKTIIMTFAYDSARVTVDHNPTSSDLINETLGRIDDDYYSGEAEEDSLFYGYQALLSEAEDYYTLSINSDWESGDVALASSRLIDGIHTINDILEIRFLYSNYYGGSHGTYAYRTVAFDTKSGKEIVLSDLWNNEQDFRNTVLSYMMLLAEKDNSNYYSERTAYVDSDNRESLFSALIEDGRWFLTDQGLLITSDPYELGPYSAGICEFEIPYEALENSIKSCFVPTNHKERHGELGLQHAEESEETNMDIIDRITVDEDGTDLILSVKGSVYDLKIFRVSYLEQFYDQTLLWYGNTVEDKAIQLKIRIPKGMPAIGIRYHDAEGNHSYLIQYENKNGFSLIREEEIAAVG